MANNSQWPSNQPARSMGGEVLVWAEFVIQMVWGRQTRQYEGQQSRDEIVLLLNALTQSIRQAASENCIEILPSPGNPK